MSLPYPEVGATRAGPLPAGYNHLRHRTCLGDVPFAAAGEAILTWRMHRATGARIRTAAGRAAPGVRLSVGLGPLVVPCEVVWSEDGPEWIGFGYGTLPGHPASGEEAFVVVRDGAGAWFEVTAFSRPVHWAWRLGGPVVPLLQRLYAARCARALARLVRLESS